MKDIRGKEQKAYIVRDTKTGATAITYESYAKKLQKDGTKKILAVEGDKDFEKYKTKRTNK